MSRAEGEKKRFDAYVWITLGLALVIRFINYFRVSEASIRSDDFGTMIYPAYLAGYDWTDFIKTAGNYYGYGYYWIFAPLFRLISSPMHLHIAIVMINGCMVALSAVLVYHLLTKYCSFDRKPLTAVYAILPTLFLSTPTNGHVGGSFWYRMDNEVPFFLTCWLFVWVVFRALDENGSKKKKWFDSALAAIVLVYSLTVHERAMAVVLSVLFLEIFLFLIRRKWVFSPLVFFPVFAAGFAGQRMLRKWIISVLWMGGWPGKNTSAFSRVSLWFLESRDALKTFLIVLIGNLQNLVVTSLGLVLFAMVLVLSWVGKSTIDCLKKQRKETTERWLEPSMLIMLIFGMAIMITIAGIAVRWGVLLLPGIRKNDVVYAYKGIAYERYYYTLIGPVLLGLSVYIRKVQFSRKGTLIATWGIFAVLEPLAYVLPIRLSLKAMSINKDYAKRIAGYGMIHGFSPKRQILIGGMLTVATMVLLSATLLQPDEKKKEARGFRIPVCAFVLFAFAVIVFNQLTYIKPSKPAVQYTNGKAAADVVGLLNEEDALPNFYLPYHNGYFQIVWMYKDLHYLGYDESEDIPDGENLIILKEENQKLLDKGYEVFQVDIFYFHTNCEKTAEALSRITDTPRDEQEQLFDAA